MNYEKLSSIQSNFFRNSVIPPLGRRSMRDEGMVTFNHNAMSFATKIINYSESPAESMKKWQIPLRTIAIILTKCGGCGGIRHKRVVRKEYLCSKH